jgi:hypothetical protein
MNNDPYNDLESRLVALEILRDFNPQLNEKKDVIDITCDDFYVDVKRHYHTFENARSLGINKDSYDKYKTLDKKVYILFILNDSYCIFDLNSPFWQWTGVVTDCARGKVVKTIYNYNKYNAVEFQYLNNN